MALGNQWYIVWIGWKGSLFCWNEARMNTGGYLYSASPYRYWRLGPIKVMRYM